ncbi:MAG: 5-bromo-4-chloroindolyl phosphate hydrolysis family protein [Candidatus Heteroscillospira sp.]|jgi:5-bromo-4-chloroindolyl phosphate hydrolysis protein
MAAKNKKRGSGVGSIYVFAIVWAVLAFILPIYKLWALAVAAALSAMAAAASRPVFAKHASKSAPVSADEEVQPESDVSYGAEIDAIIAEGKTAQKEMGRLYSSIQNADVRARINKIMEISDKIVQDAVHDPSDVPQIKRFLSYYLPTTIKLLNAYDRMGSQGIRGENISGTMERIEDMLDTAIKAYEKQLDSLFANQALDIETDIQVMNSMLNREGLGNKDF